MNLIAVTRAQAGKGPRAQSVAGTIGIPGGCGPMKAGRRRPAYGAGWV